MAAVVVDHLELVRETLVAVVVDRQHKTDLARIKAQAVAVEQLVAVALAAMVKDKLALHCKADQLVRTVAVVAVVTLAAVAAVILNQTACRVAVADPDTLPQALVQQH